MMRILDQYTIHNDENSSITVVLSELRNGYGVYFYNHEDDCYEEHMTTSDVYEAQEQYSVVVFRAIVKRAIYRAAKKRIARGAGREDINRYKQQLLSNIKDPDVRQFIYYLDNLVFDH